MEIYYKETIIDKIDEAIKRAKNVNKEIDYVYLNDLEFTEYRHIRGFGLDEEYKGIKIRYKGELSN